MARPSLIVGPRLGASLLAIVLGSMSATVATAQGGGQVRDPRTGTVWTPQPSAVDTRLDHDNWREPAGQLPTPADRAFDPQAQVAVAQPLSVQRPQVIALGTVPIAAGPTVPVVTLEGPSLQAVPGQTWLTVLYLSNNSAGPADAQVGCTFTNGGRAVQEARIVVPTVAPGQRVGFPVYGPRTDLFVDRVLCRVLSP